MVIFGLTVIIAKSTGSTTAVSALILTFLLPAVLFSALAGVFVDRLDRRLVLILTNVLRGLAFIAMFFVGDHLGLIYLLNILVSTITVFFAPAEAAMIPILVPRKQLLSANGIFTLTLNAAFAIGFTLIGPLIVKIAGAPALIVVVAGLYFVAAAFCSTLPSAPPARLAAGPTDARGRVREAENAVGSVLLQLREGLDYIRGHREIRWSLTYLGIAASLVGVLGVLGPNFAQQTLGLGPEDFVVVVLPLGAGIVMGILLLNAYGRLHPPTAGDRGRLDRARRLPDGDGPVRADQQLPGQLGRADRGRPVPRDVAPVGRRRGRVLRGDRLRIGRDPGPDAAPGGPPGGRPRAGVRRPQHARLGRELPADPRRRADRRPPGHDDRPRDRGPADHGLGRRLDLPSGAAPGGRARLAGDGRRRPRPVRDGARRRGGRRRRGRGRGRARGGPRLRSRAGSAGLTGRPPGADPITAAVAPLDPDPGDPADPPAARPPS